MRTRFRLQLETNLVQYAMQIIWKLVMISVQIEVDNHNPVLLCNGYEIIVTKFRPLFARDVHATTNNGVVHWSVSLAADPAARRRAWAGKP